MSLRKVQQVIKPRPHHYVGDGFRVHNFIPAVSYLSMQRMSPFLLLDYGAKFYFSPTDKPRGVGVHPHRGFETVTIAYKGKIAHHDSTGAGGVIDEGDIQWMTAASGILHKEYHEKNWAKHGGDMQMVQLWINLPAKDKMSEPKYQAITNDMMAKYQLSDNAGIIEVISGFYKDAKGPAFAFTPVNLMNAKLNKDGKSNFSFPAEYNTGMLVIEGEIKVNETEIAPADNFVLFENTGEDFTLEAVSDSIVLLMSGEPINEPIASQGPFVMNTRDELMQAFNDYHNGKFGYLED